MKKCVCVSLGIAIFLLIIFCLIEPYFRIVPIEECSYVEVQLMQPRCAPVTSGVLDSEDALSLYLHTREFLGHQPFVGQGMLDSLQFSEYDYMLSEGQPIIKLTRLRSDECSSYDRTGLIPVEPVFGGSITSRVYIYKISPKNKYRQRCN